MKYIGIVRITDEDENIVFERELTADEMLEQVMRPDIERIIDTSIKHDVPAGDRRFAPNKKVLVMPEKKEAKGYEAKVKHLCCGSKQARHKKGCPGEGAVPSKPTKNTPIAKTDHGRILTEEEYNTTREMHEYGKNTMQIRNELGDDCTFQQINWAMLIKPYENYVEHAESMSKSK